MIKINFKQPKYIFPLVVFVPLCISMNMPMAIIRPMVIPQKMSLPKIWRKSNAGAMNGKRQSRADWA